jgi:hypothetical protein
LRTSPCCDNPLLAKFNTTLRQGLCDILNINLSNDQWTQASLPIHNGGLGIRSAGMLAPSAFLASAAATLQLQNDILHPPMRDTEDSDKATTLTSWHNLSQSEEPPELIQTVQKTWDHIVTAFSIRELAARLSTPIDQARLLAATAEHSRDWLQAPPITSIGL